MVAPIATRIRATACSLLRLHVRRAEDGALACHWTPAVTEIALRRSGRVLCMLVAFSIPSAADETGGVSAAVAQAVKVVRDSGLPYETNAMFTNVEGEWDEVMTVVKRAVEVVVAASPRASLVLKADIRPGHTGQLTAKVRRVEERLAARDQPKGSQR